MGDRRRWAVLAAGLTAMTAGCAFQYGLPYLIPALRREGLSLGEAGALAACPTFGLLLTLILWGAAADRWGERRILGGGLFVAGLLLLAAAHARGTPALAALLVLAGAAGASVHASSGRLILGWFAQHERGLAMGVRQTAQPLGVAVAALALPALAAGGRAAAFRFLALPCLAAAGLVAVVVRDPPRPAAPAVGGAPSPYRTPVLWRLHGAAALLVVPQFVVATFSLVYLVDARGWDAPAAGRLLAAAQFGGAAARLGAGHWSDRVHSRVRPMRTLAVLTAAVLAVLAAGAAGVPLLGAWVVPVAAVLSVSTNGLSYTAVAEHAGPFWAGRAFGIHNTAQNACAAITPPAVAVVIGAAGYATAFGAAAALPVAAALLVPVRTAQRRTAGARHRQLPAHAGEDPVGVGPVAEAP